MTIEPSALLLLLSVFSLPYASFVDGFHLSFSAQSQSDRASFELGALPKEKLLQLAQDYVANPTPDALADDFVFRGPVIGPLNKNDFAATLRGVSAGKNSLKDAFPDMQTNNFGFTADDPVEPNRVWYFTRPNATFSQPFDHPVAGTIEPTGAAYVAPPEARSIVFDDEGKVKYQSVGYVTDRFTGDTTGGQGAVFGMYAVMGQGIDDTIGSPITILLQKLSDILPASVGIPKSYSKKEALPSWWTDPRMGSEK